MEPKQIVIDTDVLIELLDNTKRVVYRNIPKRDITNKTNSVSIGNLGKFVCKTQHYADGNKKNKLDRSNFEG